MKPWIFVIPVAVVLACAVLWFVIYTDRIFTKPSEELVAATDALEREEKELLRSQEKLREAKERRKKGIYGSGEVKLALVASSGSHEHEYHTVAGQVRNISSEPLDNVVAVVSWYDSKDNFIKADDALITYDPILPSQVSPFTVPCRGNPEMRLYRIEFRRKSMEIAYQDERKQKHRR